jgi:hypothetical protein
MKYSRICKVDGKAFRYDYENSIVEYVAKADEEMIKDNEEWKKKHGEELWYISDGYYCIASAGLMKENWTNKESRMEYLTMWADELREEAACLTQQYLMWG